MNRPAVSHHAHSHENTVPRPALAMAGGLVALSLALTTAVQVGWLEREAVPSVERAKASVEPSASRELRFEDGLDGSVRIIDAKSGELVQQVMEDTPSGGFIRGVMRGMARERRMSGIGAQPPFTLTLWQDGSLSLSDSATGRNVELGGFGADNRAVFFALLKKGNS
ncbi:MAG: photosynthetic complex assembly protein PuhC [Erythrobacter sp.]